MSKLLDASVMAKTFLCCFPVFMLAFVGNGAAASLYADLLLVVFLLHAAAFIDRVRSICESEFPLGKLLQLAGDRTLLDFHRRMLEDLAKVRNIPDPMFVTVSRQRINELSHKLHQIAEGHLEFDGTEAWRLTYASLLQSSLVHHYRSVAWIQSEEYWQDEPGSRSTQLNLELSKDRKLTIERIVIVADRLWPVDSILPIDPIGSWIYQQHSHGINVSLVRESALVNEPDLLSDFGIYGSHVVGHQIIDPSGQAKKFLLSFRSGAFNEAEGRWIRLSEYARPLKDLVEKPRTIP